jgi:hypothetical protein
VNAGALALIATLALPPSARMSAARAPVAPTIDGRLDEPTWQVSAASRDFVQRFPDEGASPSEITTVRVVYDDVALCCRESSS